MASEIFSVIGDAITGFANNLGSAMSSITALFYTPGTGTTPGSFTFLGILCLLTAGCGLLFWSFHLVRKALHIGV